VEKSWRNTNGLRRGGPGRRKGVPNKATCELKEFWTEFFESAAYRENAKDRIMQGKAPQLESDLLAKVYGKPTDQLEVSGPKGTTISVHDHFALQEPSDLAQRRPTTLTY
jgi:hypothetical protein